MAGKFRISRQLRLSFIIGTMAAVFVGGWLAKRQPVTAQSGLPETRFAHISAATPVNVPTGSVQLCQAFQPCLTGVDCAAGGPCSEPHWKDARPIPFQMFGHGEYIGPAREQHVPEYRIRVDDQLEFVYRLTRESTGKPYELNIGDDLRVEVMADNAIDRKVQVQPDDTIVLPYIGTVRAAGLTVTALRELLTEKYQKLYPDTTVTVTPEKVNTKLDDMRAAVDRRFGTGGQDRQAKVTPEGTIQLPAIGSITAQGLTLDEIKYEIDERYAQVVQGLEVTPVLLQRAPSYIFVLGDVRTPGRFTLERPTSVMGAIALAGSWTNGGNLRQIIVFRRTDDWRTIATKLDIRGAVYGQRPCPADDIYLRDADVVVVPKSAIKAIDEAIELLFTRGMYAALPGTANYRPFTLTTFD